MSESAENKLKSKYESSSQKIQQLYEEFANMKKNVTSNKFKARQLADDVSSKKNEGQSKVKQISHKLFPLQSKSKQQVVSNEEKLLMISNTVFQCMDAYLVEIKRKIDQKIQLYESRLQNANKIIRELAQINHNKLPMKNNCKCSQFQTFAQIKSKYQRQLSELTSNYEGKISMLVKQHQDSSTSTGSGKQNVEVLEEIRRLEDDLMVKQQQITSLKLEASRLRRGLNQHKQLVSEKDSLIAEISRQIDQKTNNNPKDSNLQSQNYRLQKELIFVQQEIKSLKKQIQPQKSLEIKQRNTDLIRSSTRSVQFVGEEDDPNQILKHAAHDIGDFDEFEENKFEPLRHTQYFNSHKQKVPHKQERHIKELEADLQLLQQENKLLKNKKDKFEYQVKENETDQQRFQVQFHILRDELRLVGNALKQLDECAVLYMKDKKVPEQSVHKLQDGLKFKEQLSKKPIKRKFSFIL